MKTAYLGSGTGSGPTPPGTSAAAAMPLALPDSSGAADWPSQTAVMSSEILNGSSVLSGQGSVKDALNSLLASSGTPLLTGTALTDANQTLATSERYFMLAGTTTAARTKTLTPGAAGAGFLIEIALRGITLPSIMAVLPAVLSTLSSLELSLLCGFRVTGQTL